MRIHSITFSRDRKFPRGLRGYGLLRKPSARDITDPATAPVAPHEVVEQLAVTEAPSERTINTIPEGWTAISPRQESVHRFVETLALVVQLPFCAYLAMHPKLPGWARLMAAAAGVTTLVVDGGLLMTFAAKDRGEEGPFSGGRR